MVACVAVACVGSKPETGLRQSGSFGHKGAPVVPWYEMGQASGLQCGGSFGDLDSPATGHRLPSRGRQLPSVRPPAGIRCPTLARWLVMLWTLLPGGKCGCWSLQVGIHAIVNIEISLWGLRHGTWLCHVTSYWENTRSDVILAALGF